MAGITVSCAGIGHAKTSTNESRELLIEYGWIHIHTVSVSGVKKRLSRLYATVFHKLLPVLWIIALSMFITLQLNADKAGQGGHREVFATIQSRHDSRYTLYEIESINESNPRKARTLLGRDLKYSFSHRHATRRRKQEHPADLKLSR